MKKRRWLTGLGVLFLIHIGVYLFEPELAYLGKSLRARFKTPPSPVSWTDQGLTEVVPSPEVSPSPEGDPGLTFIAVGHLRSVLSFPSVAKKLAHQINTESPDLVFLLGDFTVDGNTRQWKQMDAFLDLIPAPVYACPGNHEYARGWAVSLEEGRARYQRRFESMHRFVPAPGANFILIDSNDSLNTIREYLGSYLDRCNPQWPTILLSHHKLWVERPDPKWFHKPFSPGEILPLLEGRVHHVLAGDIPDDGREGHGLSYTPSMVRGIQMHPVGIGDSGYGHPVVYGRGEVGESGVTVSLRYLRLDPGDSWNTVRMGSAHTAFQGLSFGKKIQLYFRYLGRLRLPRGRAPLLT